MPRGRDAETKGCLTVIRNHLPSLSPAEQRIGQYILDNPERSLNLGIVVLAKQCSVSPAMITRFCTQIGFSGFSAMKANLRVDILSSDELFFEDIDVNDSDSTIMEKVMELAILGLKDTLATLDRNELVRASQAILGARPLFFAPAGTSSSGIIGLFRQKLLNLGIVTVSPPEFYLLQLQASHIKEGDVVLGISHSGASQPVVEFLEQCQGKKATTICLTNYNNSPITKVSDIQLITAASRSSPLFGEAIAARVGQLAVIDSLYAIMAIMQYRQEASKK